MVLEWKEQYNCYSLETGLFTIHVYWTSDGYEIKYGSYKVKKKFSNIKDAKSVAITNVMVKLKKLISNLEWIHETP